MDPVRKISAVIFFALLAPAGFLFLYPGYPAAAFILFVSLALTAFILYKLPAGQTTPPKRSGLMTLRSARALTVFAFIPAPVIAGGVYVLTQDKALFNTLLGGALVAAAFGAAAWYRAEHEKS